MKLVDLDKVKELLDFSNNAIYTILLIARKKNNPGITNSKEIVYRETVRDLVHFDKKVNKLLSLAENRAENFKLYISFNPRDPLGAYKKLKYEFADWDEAISKSPEALIETTEKIKRIDCRFISCLQKSPMKKKYFMLDLDDKSKLQEVILLMDEHLEDGGIFFETKNGWHILFTPCDTGVLMEEIMSKDIDCELKRDDLLCIGYSK